MLSVFLLLYREALEELKNWLLYASIFFTPLHHPSPPSLPFPLLYPLHLHSPPLLLLITLLPSPPSPPSTTFIPLHLPPPPRLWIKRAGSTAVWRWGDIQPHRRQAREVLRQEWERLQGESSECECTVISHNFIVLSLLTLTLTLTLTDLSGEIDLQISKTSSRVIFNSIRYAQNSYHPDTNT